MIEKEGLEIIFKKIYMTGIQIVIQPMNEMIRIKEDCMPNIETTGIGYLNIFLNGTNFDTTSIHVNDKTVSWDGELILLSDTSGSKKNAKKASVQVKSEYIKKTKVSEHTSPVDLIKEDLENYASNGGIILIKIEYTNETYGIYTKCLYVNELKGLVKKTNKYKTIRCDRCHNAQEFLKHFISFHVNMYYQLNEPIEMNKLGKIENIVINTVGNQSQGLLNLDIFGDKTKVYAKLNNELIPIKETITEVKEKRVLNVTLDDYSASIPVEYVKNLKDSKMMIHHYIEFNLKTGQFSMMIKPEYEVKKIVDAIDFIFKFVHAKKAMFEKNSVQLNDYTINLNELDKTLQYSLKMIELFDKLNISLTGFTVSDVKQYKQEINILLEGYLDKSPMLAESDSDSFYNYLKIKDHAFVLIFNRVHGMEKRYHCQNFTEINLNVEIEVEDKVIDFTGYVMLPPEILAYMDIKIEHFKTEIDKYTANDETTLNLFSKMQLNFINAYDISEKVVLLDCAQYVNSLNIINEGIAIINDLQIIKRKRDFTDDDKERVLQAHINENHPLYQEFECCKNILLGEYTRLMSNYAKLDNNQKEFFITWPIINLLPENYRQKLRISINKGE